MKNMSKQLKDYLHLYLGCECIIGDKKGKLTAMQSKPFDQAVFRSDEDSRMGHLVSVDKIKPILRPLSDMTDKEWLHIFSLARGIVIQDDSIYKIEKHSNNEVCIRISLAQFLLSCQEHHNADVRVPKGVSFRLKYFYTSNSLEVTEVGINEAKNEFTPMTDEWDNFCFNQSEIFIYLLSKHFDLFGLIEAGLAIDKTKVAVI